MNKLMGFYELKDLDLPAVPWKQYTGEEQLDGNLLWTVRSAVYQGDDQNLPRLVGCRVDHAREFADRLLKRFDRNGIVIYYPFFLANKSGTLNIYREKTVIEAVKEDLWNLVTYSDREVTVTVEGDTTSFYGDREFLDEKELELLLSHVGKLRRTYRDELTQGKSLLLEWSFARNCNLEKEPVGREYLIFYEIRTVM